MSDDSWHHVSGVIEAARAALARDGYALTSDNAIGLPDDFRENFRRAYFNAETLHHDEGDWPVDRLRARDVIRYQWCDGDLLLQRHDTITITDRADIPGKREHTRVELLKDPDATNLIRAFLHLIPVERRQDDGTFGMNLFRTFTNVVTKPHHDDEEFIIIYVVDRVGDGAETHLYAPEDVADDGSVRGAPVFKHQLNPGDLIVFEDKRFKHDASPLVALPDGNRHRDAVVCTVDYRSTYLGPPN